MAGIDDLSDAEVGRIVRAAEKAKISQKKEKRKILDAFLAWLSAAGFAWVTASFKTADLTWDSVKWLYHRIFKK